MFDTVEECDAYWYSVRRNNCREDWTTLHNRWNQQTVASNPNLVLGQTLRPDSGNYQFFPQEHLVDIKVGTGDMAKEGENAVVNIVSADIRGTTYTNLVSVVSRTADPGTFKNKVINMTPHYLPGYYSYYLGVIGMRVGGTRDITFTSDENFLFTGSKLPIEVKAAEPITYRVELLSLKGDRFYQEDLEP